MKKTAKYTLLLLSIIFSIFFNACTKPENVSSDDIKLPFDFTYYGVIPVGSGIKEIHDTLGIHYKSFYFTSAGKLNRMIYQFRGSLYVGTSPALRDTTIILDYIMYNSNNQLIAIGNAFKSDVYAFEYTGNSLSKATDNSSQLFPNSLSSLTVNTFISDNSENFTSSVYQLATNCPVNKTYHYTQNKLDSISAINSSSCSSPLITTSSLQFFYTNNLITGIKVLTNLSHFDPDVTLIYSDDKLIEIKQPNSIIQGAPHTTFTYY